MKNYLLLLFLAAAFTFSSCGKDDDSDPAPVVQNDPANDPAAISLTSDLITSHEWQLIGLTQSVPGQAIQNDIYNNSFPACQRDDVYNFITNNNGFTVSPNLTACPSNNQWKNGNWKLVNAKTLTLNTEDLTQAGLTGEFTIILLDNNSMVLKQTVNNNEFTATYQKNEPVTKTKILTANTWKLNSIIMQSPGSQPIDIYASAGSCSKDDRTKFLLNGTYEISEGPTKCDPNDPQVYETGPWMFKNNETILDIDGIEFEIIQLTLTYMILKFDDNGTVSTYTFSI